MGDGQKQLGARRWMAERPAFAAVIAAMSGMKLAELAKAVVLRNQGVVATNATRYEPRLERNRAEKPRMKQVQEIPQAQPGQSAD